MLPILTQRATTTAAAGTGDGDLGVEKNRVLVRSWKLIVVIVVVVAVADCRHFLPSFDDDQILSYNDDSRSISPAPN